MRFTFPGLQNRLLSLTVWTAWFISRGPKHFDVWNDVGLDSGLFQQVHIFLVIRAPDLDAGLQMESHESEVAGKNHLPLPAGLFFWCSPGYTWRLHSPGYYWLSALQVCIASSYFMKFPSMRIPLSVLICRATLNEFFSQSVLMSGVWKHTQVFGAM